MTDLLHAATRAIVSADSPGVALDLARVLASGPPADFEPREWLTIAMVACGCDEPAWYAVSAFAHEQLDDRRSPVDALNARANLIIAVGPDEADSFRSLSEFVARARAVIGLTTPQEALERYAGSRRTIVTVGQDSSEWDAARHVFLRCRLLRELACVLKRLAGAEATIPQDLRAWLTWEDLSENDLDLVVNEPHF